MHIRAKGLFHSQLLMQIQFFFFRISQCSERIWSFNCNSEVYSESSETYNMECFAKKLTAFSR